jgi:S-methylmethionine-dependent homocysteine/selenocysteine methylase
MLLTDGGLETTLIFHRGIDLPHFAAFGLLEEEAGVEALRAYFRPYLEIAAANGSGFVLDTVTWRANPDWAARLGYTPEALDAANRRSVKLARELRDEYAGRVAPILIEGVIGPRDDGYAPSSTMSAADAERYHSRQVETLAQAGVDWVAAITMAYADEAIGIVRAAQAAGTSAVVSFTLETDGRLPDGQPLPDAIEQVDAETGSAARYFMVNCAHPTHFADVLEAGGAWVERIEGIRANASTMSHAELDESGELDDGDPHDLGARYAELRRRLPRLDVVGGCCGTDERHIGAICAALALSSPPAG